MSDCQEPTRTLRVGAIQIESQPGRIEANHARATAMVEEAARSGAELVVLPELFACGYVPNKFIWDYAEPLAGPTATWLRETSRRLGIYLGAGMTETDGTDFFNAYLITAPDGEIAGHIRKTMAEAYCFKRSEGSHVVDTAIGRIGIGICADNHYTRFAGLIQAGSVDLMLMPHAWPTPFKTSAFVSEGDVLKAENDVINWASLYADLLGVPVVFVNPVGPLGRMAGLFGRLMDTDRFCLQGLSRIVDSNGTVKGALGKEEGVVVADVLLDPSRKRNSKPQDYGGWLHPGSWLIRKVLMPVDVALGTMSYRGDAQRREKARRWSE